MATEIERKFLVTGSFTAEITASRRLVQGYLTATPARTVRVRLDGTRGFLTIKGPTNSGGTTRFEWEQELSLADGEALLALAEPGVIAKTRHLVPAGQHIYEVDVFEGENTGLIVAEIELTAEDELFERPAWLGPEVTGDPRYYNSALMRHPFGAWG
jgi:CYTH domain-containing protein